MAPRPALVGQTDDARDVFRLLRERADAEYARAEAANDPAAMAIWARAYEKVRRLALIYACSVNRLDPMVSRDGANGPGRSSITRPGECCSWPASTPARATSTPNENGCWTC